MLLSKRKPGGESPNARLFLVSVSVMFCMFMSGIIFGYSGIYKALVFEAKAFSSTCKEGESLPCEKQHDHLTMMYTMGASTISGCAFPVGIFLDYFGPRVTVCVGAAISAFSLLSLAYASFLSDYLYYVGFVGLAIGGPCIANSVTNFGELFGQNSAAIISAQTGAFNSSSLVMFLLGQLVTEWGLSFSSVMIGYSIVPVIIFVTSFLFFCDEPYRNEQGKDQKGEIHRAWKIRQKLKHKEDNVDEPSFQEPLLEVSQEILDSSPKDLYNIPFKQQISSFVFWSMFLVTGFFVLRVNFYISTISSQLLYEASNVQSPPFSDPQAALEVAQNYVALFNVIMAVGGIIMVPIIGYVLVKWGLGPSFAIISITNTAFSVVNLLNWIPVKYQILSFIFFAASRPFVFGTMAAYVGRIFGFQNFGKLYGLARLSGSVATAMNYPLSRLAEGTFHGNYYLVNLGFLCMEAAMFVFPIYLCTVVFSGFLFRPETVPDEENREQIVSENTLE